MDLREEHKAIIDRCEHVRKRLNLNKSEFGRRIGIKPQTLNNFLGAQGSKPNVELICGVIRAFGVNPMWLLFGEGLAFTEGTPLPPQPSAPGIPAGTGELTDRVSALEEQTAAISEDVSALMHLFSPSVAEVKRRLEAEEVQPGKDSGMEVRHA